MEPKRFPMPDLAEHEEWDVKEVKGERKLDGGLLSLVKWKWYPRNTIDWSQNGICLIP